MSVMGTPGLNSEAAIEIVDEFREEGIPGLPI